MSGNAIFRYSTKRNDVPARSDSPATTRFADAPINVPLPPRQAPSDSAHHSGSSAASPPSEGPIALISGSIVATNGMLSMNADRTADAQRITSVVILKSPFLAPTT